MQHHPEPSPTGEVVGLVLAAGSGLRMGGPKALLVDAGGRTLLQRSVEALLDGGADRVIVVVGAEAERVETVLGLVAELVGPGRVSRVVAADHASGPGVSLKTGLTALAAEPSTVLAAVVMLVDLPGVGPEAVRRITARADRTSLVRASYGGHPGHPVLLGREHWAPLTAALEPGQGANPYLRRHQVALVTCDDIADGTDLDQPADAAARGWGWPDRTAGGEVLTDLRAIPSLVGDPPAWEPSDRPADPISLFAAWFGQALAAGVPEPHAMTVSTVDADGVPDARVLILKGLTSDGTWSFAGDRSSAKGEQLKAQPAAALTFYWSRLVRSVRIRGPVAEAAPEVSARDFASRSAAARAAAGPAADWVVWLLRAEQIEFWQGSPDRSHHRLHFRRTEDGWTSG